MTNKFHYVKSAKLDPTDAHTCHWPDCHMEIPREHHMCAEHWLTLPKILRDRIWAAYEPGQERDERLLTAEYIDAASAARRWAETFIAANQARQRRPA